MSAFETAENPISLGRLANNGMAVKALQAALGRAETNLTVIPKLVLRVIRDNAWRHWYDADSGEFMGKDFRAFIEGKKPAGCETPLYLVERALKDTVAWVPFIELTRGEPGNPVGTNQWTEGKCDNVTLSSPEPEIIPILSKPPTGNSVSYAVRRLGRKRPDLLERVKAGEITAHAAMVKAGFAPHSITIPDDPTQAARRLKKHFQGDRLEALIRGLRG